MNQRMAEHQQIRGFTIWPDEDFPRTHTLKVKKNDLLEYPSNLASGTSEAAAPEGSRDTSAQVNLVSLLARVSGALVSEITPDMTIGGSLGLDSLGRVELLSSV